MRPPFVFLAATVLLASCGTGADRPSRDELLTRTRTHNVLVALIDAAAAGHFGAYGYDRPTSPRIDALARESVLFEQAYAQATGTSVSVYSFFTSRYPMLERVPILGPETPIFLTDEVTTLAEALAVRFPHRLAISINPHVSQQLGYGQGFTDMFEDWQVPPGGRAGNPPYATRVPPLALPWLRTKGDDGYFAYLHYIEPHAPYMPPEPHLSRLARREPDVMLGSMTSLRNMKGPQPVEMRERVIDLYDGNISYIDGEIGALVDTLRAWGEWERTIFVLMSDHGEAFWEHGAKGHGGVPHEELVRVPLLVHIPGFPSLEGVRIQEPVELVDLMPTLLELCDVPTESIPMVGRSWVPAMLGERGRHDEPRLIHMRSNQTRRPVFAMRYGRWKWLYKVEKERQELFDLRVDPRETQNLLAGDAAPPDLPVDFPLLLRQWLEGAPGDGSCPVAADQIDEKMLESLRSLGYVD